MTCKGPCGQQAGAGRQSRRRDRPRVGSRGASRARGAITPWAGVQEAEEDVDDAPAHPPAGEVAPRGNSGHLP